MDEQQQALAGSESFDLDHYLSQNPGIALGGISGQDLDTLVDARWYLEHNPDVAQVGVHPLAHFLRWGCREGRDPNPLFTTDWYLERNPDVAAAGVPPLLHYLRWGAARGLDPCPLFDTAWYLERNPDVAATGTNPLVHFLRWGAGEGRDPGPLFETNWYLDRNPDVAAARPNAVLHFLRWGGARELKPNPLFDPSWYLAQDPDVAATGVNPLIHYLRWGVAKGLDPNPLFDTDWYLERYPDVAAAGVNPLLHFVRWGAARRLSPGPSFDTHWYLDRYPDVAAAGINPLKHFLEWGLEEGREPVSPIPQLFERFAKKLAISAAEFERLKLIYTSPLGIQIDKATADNNIAVGVAWAEQFMSASLACHDRGDWEGALRFAKRAVQTWPHEDDPITLYCSLFAQCNRDAISTFMHLFASAKLLVIHVSHKLGLKQAEDSCRSFDDPTGRIFNVIVVGEDLPEDVFRFDVARSILFVPASDTYEALAQKVAKAMLFIGLCPLSVPVLKVDDDAVCEDIGRLAQLIDETFSRHLYGGRVNPRASTASCSFWHFGKCTDESINYVPDGLFWIASYAGGQGYWLNGKAVSALAKIALMHERHFEVEHFEDRALGTAFAQYGVRPFYFDLIKAGVLSDLNQPPLLEKMPPARLRGTHAKIPIKTAWFADDKGSVFG